MKESRAKILVGTASWTDPTLVNSDLFYPRSVKTPEERLRFYAEHFDTVEVDSTYYAMPSEKNAKLWAERTPEKFIFNVKPFALMTQHPAEISRLPKDLREMLPVETRRERQLKRPPAKVVDKVFEMFSSAMAPLREAGKLGMLAFQFPPYFVAKPANFEYLASLKERLAGESIAIEFRHPSWVAEPGQRRETMEFLRSHGLYYTSIDAPHAASIVPSFVEATGDQIYVRFHGRNRESWFKRNITAAERFKYLYSESELGALAKNLEDLEQRGVRRGYAIFNNCYQNFGIMNASTMATILSSDASRA